MQVVANGQVVNYQKTGHGRCLIFVHGWGDSLATFSGLQNAFSESYTVVSLDLPGFGNSQALNRTWDLGDYADCIDSFVQKLDLDVYAFVGHSNGGAILIYGLANYKLSAKKLVLLASAGIRNKHMAKKQLLKLTAKSGKVATSVLPASWQKSIKKRFYDSLGSELTLIPNMESTFKQIVGHDVQADAAKLSLPTLIIYGQNDQTTPVSYGKTLNELIKGSQLKILDSAGHFVHHDKPSETEELIRGFLK